MVPVGQTPVIRGRPQESIFDNVAAEQLPDLAPVVAYLHSGHVLIDMMDIANDPSPRPPQSGLDGANRPDAPRPALCSDSCGFRNRLEINPTTMLRSLSLPIERR